MQGWGESTSQDGGRGGTGKRAWGSWHGHRNDGTGRADFKAWQDIKREKRDNEWCVRIKNINLTSYISINWITELQNYEAKITESMKETDKLTVTGGYFSPLFQ